MPPQRGRCVASIPTLDIDLVLLAFLIVNLDPLYQAPPKDEICRLSAKYAYGPSLVGTPKMRPTSSPYTDMGAPSAVRGREDCSNTAFVGPSWTPY
mgnify:CR=1 FL=1